MRKSPGEVRAVNIASLLHRTRRVYPQHDAIAYGDEVVATYATWADRAARLAGGLCDRFGLKPGDRVALFMSNCPAYLDLLFGIWHAGLVAVPVNAKLSGNELSFILENSAARVCVVTADRRTAAETAAVEASGLEAIVDAEGEEIARCASAPPAEMASCSAPDPAWLFYTSGTTGRPKGAILTHRNLMNMTAAYFMGVESVQPGDGMLHAAPLSHGSGLYALPQVAAAALQIVPKSRGFDADELLGLLQTYHNVSFFAAPTMVKRLSERCRARQGDPRGLKTIVYGGGPMHLEVLRDAIEVFGYKLAEIYGQGESPMTITAMSKEMHAHLDRSGCEDRLAAVGIAQPMVDIRIVDDRGRRLPPGEVGEIAVRGDTVMAGYWMNADATAKTIVDGWLYTGDCGCFDDQGLLYLKDRTKDVIISGGTNIYTREVEDALLAHHGVYEVAVIGAPDPDWGEVVVAFVVARADHQVDAQSLDRHCLERMARFKRPRTYHFLDELPKSAYGKIVKTSLREAAEAGQPAV